jgi:acid stress-induced BolA-like protein IbaG/YrbA
MQSEDVAKILSEALNECEITVAGEGNHFQLTVVGEMFEGMNSVKRQQSIYACLNSYIADGTIHAITMKTYTPVEWQKIS